MDNKFIEITIDIVLILVVVTKVIHLHYECKAIKALIESAKTSKQRLDMVEEELQKLNV